MRKYCALALSLVFATQLFADQVVLTNGDRLTGTITKSDDKSLVLKTDYADDVTNPPSGTKKNDILLTTGLNITLTHQMGGRI